jgi:hypothetical protein
MFTPLRFGHDDGKEESGLNGLKRRDNKLEYGLELHKSTEGLREKL